MPVCSGCLGEGRVDIRSSKPSSLIVFPFDQAPNIKAPAGMGGELAAALRTLLNGNETYSPILYKEKLSPIKRAREDGTLKPNEDCVAFLR